jgi:molybdopterin synthase catalytic subunit
LKNVGVSRKEKISIQRLINFVRSNRRFDEVGAVACFIGFVRGYTEAKKRVKRLELEAYTERAERAFQAIADDVKSRPGVIEVLIHHIVGRVRVGEPILFVIVAGGSRKDVFPALVETVDRVKREAAIWKKEVLASGKSYWVEYA